MTHEKARRPVSRLWLRAFAGIVAVLCASLPAAAVELALEQDLAGAPFSAKTIADERSPVAAFATENGVYELDTKKKMVRVWPRDLQGSEPKSFKGVDSDKKGAQFSHPVSFRKKRGENVIAVVDACPTVPGLQRYARVAFYSFEETLSDGVLSSVSFTLLGEIRNEALEHASDVAFFPSGDKVAVSVSANSSGPSSDDEGWVYFFDIPTSPDTPVASPIGSFYCVRTKNVYEGSSHYNSVGAEPYNVPASGVFVDPDGERIYVGTKNLSAVLRYDPVSSGVYEEDVIVRIWEYNWIDGYRWIVSTNFPGATADFVQGATGDTGVFEVPTGFSAGDLGLAGSTNNLLSLPGSIQLWESPNGPLLVVADTDNDRVVAFDEMGNARFTFNPTDRQASKFSRPQGAWVSDDGTELVVADTGNGRVEIFKLSESDSAPDETVIAQVSAAWYCETDAQVFTNWLVAAAASLTNRSYSVEVSVSPDGSAAVEPAVVEIPAGEDRAPFVLKPLDGVAGGSAGTLTVAGQSFDFIVTNAAPTVRTGPRTEGPVDNQSWLYADEGPINDPLEYMWGPFAPETFRLLVAREGSGGIHFHAKAFDVDADSDLIYKWRVVGTTNVLLIGTIAGTSLAVYEKSTPIYKWEPVWYYEYEEGVPPTVKTKVFKKDEVENFPQDDEGNYLYIETYTNQQVSAETWTVTNVLKAGEIRSDPLTDTQMIDWPPVLFDDDQNERFLVSDTTLTGSDPVFTDAEDGVLYFAMLTVTDKDGGVWNSLETSSSSFFAFATGSAIAPPVDGARYTAVFTDVSLTNVAFTVRLARGEPATTDRATLQYATALTAVWKDLFLFNPGTLMLTPTTVDGDEVTFKTGEKATATVSSDSSGIDMRFVYEEEPTDGARFYRIQQTKP